MMIKSSENENLQNLARLDFLDLCLLGETGTGKTHMARLIHELSPRKEKPFVAINCAELTPSIIEAELFGYEKGAYTGAISTKIGIFEMAAGGTLFLDEIGDLSDNLQAKLLKAVEEKCVKRVGGSRLRQIDVRIICATHQELTLLREDLRYRIAAHAVYLKPLRERREEIVSFARIFLNEFNQKSKSQFQADDETLKLLENVEWRGNIRELRSFIENICLSALFSGKQSNQTPKEIVLTDNLFHQQISKTFPREQIDSLTPNLLPSFNRGERLEEYLEKIEVNLLKNALDTHNNNQTRAAEELGISRTGLIKKLKRINH